MFSSIQWVIIGSIGVIGAIGITLVAVLVKPKKVQYIQPQPVVQQQVQQTQPVVDTTEEDGDFYGSYY